LMLKHLDGHCPVCGMKIRNLPLHLFYLADKCKYHSALAYLFTSNGDPSLLEKGFRTEIHFMHEERELFCSVYNDMVLIHAYSTNIVMTIEEFLEKVKSLPNPSTPKDIEKVFEVKGRYIANKLLKGILKVFGGRIEKRDTYYYFKP